MVAPETEMPVMGEKEGVMPKEYVYGPAGDICGFRVKVGWNREASHVQVATIDPAKEEVYDLDHDSRDGGLYVTLERGEINDLIRILRKARDQAFGRDE